MSKAVTKSLEDMRAALKTDGAEPPADAICTLLGEGLSFLERIALALENVPKAEVIQAYGRFVDGKIVPCEKQ